MLFKKVSSMGVLQTASKGKTHFSSWIKPLTSLQSILIELGISQRKNILGMIELFVKWA